MAGRTAFLNHDKSCTCKKCYWKHYQAKIDPKLHLTVEYRCGGNCGKDVARKNVVKTVNADGSIELFHMVPCGPVFQQVTRGQKGKRPDGHPRASKRGE